MKRIELEKLNNTRDLAAIELPGGRVEHGRLIRSGQLGRASNAYREWLKDNVSVVIDFRSDMERYEVPDPVIEGMVNIHCPIIDDIAAGVNRDSQSNEEAIEMLMTDPDNAMRYMCGMYETFVTSETARAGYEAFARKVLESADKPVLWHCTVGKDRAGFATAIVLEMLGADRETVMADYLATNGFIEHDLEAIANFYFGDAGSMESRAEDAFRRLFGASREFLEAAFSKAEEMYGSFRGYIRDGLHISDEEIEAWRDAMLSVPEESL